MENTGNTDTLLKTILGHVRRLVDEKATLQKKVTRLTLDLDETRAELKKTKEDVHGRLKIVNHYMRRLDKALDAPKNAEQEAQLERMMSELQGSDVTELMYKLKADNKAVHNSYNKLINKGQNYQMALAIEANATNKTNQKLNNDKSNNGKPNNNKPNNNKPNNTSNHNNKTNANNKSNVNKSLSIYENTVETNNTNNKSNNKPNNNTNNKSNNKPNNKSNNNNNTNISSLYGSNSNNKKKTSNLKNEDVMNYENKCKNSKTNNKKSNTNKSNSVLAML